MPADRACKTPHRDLHPVFNFPLAITREINRALKRGVQVDIVVAIKSQMVLHSAGTGFQSHLKFFHLYLYEMNLRRLLKSSESHTPATVAGTSVER
jgi:CDP-diacylglycerol--serine O-phosphatidyltransferase